jgi:hypothetical protein
MSKTKNTEIEPNKSTKIGFWESFKRFSSIVTVIGVAIGIFFAVRDYTIQPSIQAKIIGLSVRDANSEIYSFKNGEMNSEYCFQYLVKLNINVLNKDLSYFSMRVFLIYKDGRIIEGECRYPSRRDVWSMNEEKYHLNIPIEDFLSYNSVLYKDKTNSGYVFISTSGENFKGKIKNSNDFYYYAYPEKLRIEFLLSNTADKYISTGDINIEPDNTYKYPFDESIWIPIKDSVK